jgi:hypothetical protein
VSDRYEHSHRWRAAALIAIFWWAPCRAAKSLFSLLGRARQGDVSVGVNLLIYADTEGVVGTPPANETILGRADKQVAEPGQVALQDGSYASDTIECHPSASGPIPVIPCERRYIPQRAQTVLVGDGTVGAAEPCSGKLFRLLSGPVA